MIVLLLILFLLLPSPVEAKKKLPSRPAVAVSGLPQTSLKLRGDKHALLLSLSRLTEAKNFSYILTYQADGIGQGVEGSYDPSLGSTQKELVFGTCSGSVCTYHQNISEMLFQATIGLKDGKTLTRKYQIKL